MNDNYSWLSDGMRYDMMRCDGDRDGDTLIGMGWDEIRLLQHKPRAINMRMADIAINVA